MLLDSRHQGKSERGGVSGQDEEMPLLVDDDTTSGEESKISLLVDDDTSSGE